MDLYELLPSVVMTVLFIGILPFGQKVWINVDLIITTLWGLCCIAIPKCVMQHQIDGELDLQHEYFYRFFGFTLLGTTMFGIFTRTSTDPTVKITFLWSRVIATSVYILNRVYSIYNISKDPQWNNRSVYFGTYGDVLWFAGSLFHTLRCQDWGSGNESHLRIDFHLRLDTILTFFIALMYFVFPGHIYKIQTDDKLGKLHLSLIRVMAAFLFGSCIISASSTRFKGVDDKMTFLALRILINACIVTFQLIAQFFQSHWSIFHVYCSIVTTAVWTLNAGLGYMHEVKKSKRNKVE
uniref:Uncharacterized protein LOC111126902 n=1 Tax=Crassostrea virginica TaxID=6565 RepID=A0A8B8DI26_CRAVI|nr:uncharacterized protein LOC111126902 [Crassostrea virginica]